MNYGIIFEEINRTNLFGKDFAMIDYKTLPVPVQDFMHYQFQINHSSNSAVAYESDLKIFFRFMKTERGIEPPDVPFDEIPISDIDIEFIRGITRQDVMKFMEYLQKERIAYEGTVHESIGISSTTARRKLSCLRAFFKYLCVYEEALSRDPTQGIIPPKLDTTLPKYYTAEQGLKLLEAVSGRNEARDYAIILLALTCGLRVSEIAGINISDLRIDEGENFITVRGKGSKERQTYLTEACVTALKDYLGLRKEQYQPLKKHENALFLSQKHSRISTDAVAALVRKACLQAGVTPLSPHKLRHTAATLMLQNGVDVRTLMDVLGHTSLSVTQRYTHVANDALRVASEVNPMSKVKKHKTEKQTP
ncbi:recombinase XerC [Agathobaculum butyriciproducens]|nr:recombinase XerC [Agathobaculum butyriciproducens]RGC60909.1 recombinase XerC [Agathobaculum butyriciproducens]